VSGTAGPATQNNIVSAANAAAQGATTAAGSYALAYTMQTGPIKYAPMAVQAPSQITAKGVSRQYPTSGYSVWLRSGMSTPDATQTVTQAVTYSVSSREATVRLTLSSVNDLLTFCADGCSVATERHGKVFESMEGLASDFRFW